MRSVVVVRHGERLDYVLRDSGQNWIATSDRPWDPPLTDRGHEQAHALGNALPEILRALKLPPIAAIYASPFWRCRQTAAGLIGHVQQEDLRVQVELGLAESMNENWYRSWAIPGSDGTWGFQKQEIPLTALDTSTLHPAAKQSVEAVLDWKQAPADDTLMARMDSNHVSKSIIDLGYCMHPPKFESFKMQRRRMYETMELLSSGHLDQTIVLVSHGRCMSEGGRNCKGVRIHRSLPHLGSTPSYRFFYTRRASDTFVRVSYRTNVDCSRRESILLL
jgi:broad specificity phosphatase PhoE